MADFWNLSLEGKLNRVGGDQSLTSTAHQSIYRVNRLLREANEKAYNPGVISIGPYHRHTEGLAPMDQHKYRCLHRVLGRGQMNVDVYLNSVREVELQARSCYQGPIHLTSDEFVETMVVDGCFVLELLRVVDLRRKGLDLQQLGYYRDDPVFGMRGVMYAIQTDLIKLENQIPFFILDRLLSLQRAEWLLSLQRAESNPPPPPPPPLNQLAIEFFDRTINSFNPGSIVHLLDLFHQSSLGTQRTAEINDRVGGNAAVRELTLLLCVTKLVEVGIKIKKGKDTPFWDIKFVKGVLRIPTLLLQNNTETEFLNLMAFEMNHSKCPGRITSYLAFMDDLIDTSDDVAYLENRGIIDHVLGSKDKVAGLFNRLCKQVVVDIDDDYLLQVKKGVREQFDNYHNNKRRRWWVNMKRRYFSYPWSFISLMAASVLLVLTFLQTFYGIKYHN